MELQLNRTKGIGIKNSGVVTVTYFFNIEDLEDITELSEKTFKIKILDAEFTGVITGGSSFSLKKKGGFMECQVKIDIYIDDNLVGLILSNDIKINVGESK